MPLFDHATLAFLEDYGTAHSMLEHKFEVSVLAIEPEITYWRAILMQLFFVLCENFGGSLVTTPLIYVRVAELKVLTTCSSHDLELVHALLGLLQEAKTSI